MADHFDNLQKLEKDLDKLGEDGKKRKCAYCGTYLELSIEASVAGVGAMNQEAKIMNGWLCPNHECCPDGNTDQVCD